MTTGVGTIVEPALALAALAVPTAAYGLGCLRLARRGHALARMQQLAFLAGVVATAVAVGGPLDAAAGRSLTAHMTQHVLLALVAGPLLALGRPGLPVLVALPVPVRRRLGAARAGVPARWRRPVPLVLTALALQTAALWGWHLPAPYVAALHSPPLHAAEHVTYLLTAVAFWSVVTSRAAGGLAALAVFVGGLPAAALGAVLTLAPTPLYAGQTASGTNPLTDQQLAGLLMWVPGEGLALVAAGVLFVRWLQGQQRADGGHEVPLPPSALVPPALVPPALVPSAPGPLQEVP